MKSPMTPKGEGKELARARNVDPEVVPTMVTVIGVRGVGGSADGEVAVVVHPVGTRQPESKPRSKLLSRKV